MSTIDGCSIHPCEMVKTALLLNSAAVIFASNHPSGVPEANRADLVLKRLAGCPGLVDARVLDYIIVGGVETVSLAERECCDGRCNRLKCPP
jgi:DNA repair protein RadC